MGALLTALIAGTLAGQAAPAANPAPGVTPTNAAANCPAGASPAALPAELKGWTAMQGVTAGSSLASPASLAIGRSARATLVPSGDVTFPLAPEHAPEAGTSSGLFAFDVDAVGTYRVALDAGAWVDVVAMGKAVASSGHGHGPDCSGVRKYVDFRLQPGRYVIQVSGNKAPTLAVMVAKLGS